MTHPEPIAADSLTGVWRESEDPDHVVVFADRERWRFNVRDIHYAGEPYTATTWFIENGELVTRERWVSASGEPSCDELERRYAIELRGDELTLTDLDFDTVEVLRRERDAELVAHLSRPLVRIEPTTRDEPGLGTLRWHAQLRCWQGETVVAGRRIVLDLEGEEDDALRLFDRARAVIAQLEGGGLERCFAFASRELLGCANEWRQDGDPVLDVASFRAHMVLGALVVGPTEVSLGVNVGEVFGEHGIEIQLDADHQAVRAEMR